jgi:hypothetical protein
MQHCILAGGRDASLQICAQKVQIRAPLLWRTLRLAAGWRQPTKCRDWRHEQQWCWRTRTTRPNSRRNKMQGLRFWMQFSPHLLCLPSQIFPASFFFPSPLFSSSAVAAAFSGSASSLGAP